MEFIDKALLTYCEEHSSEEDPLLSDLTRYTHLNVLSPRMLSGHLQGKFLELISKMLQPTYVLEIGTYTGYSAYCLARGLKKEGKLISIDRNPELIDVLNKFVKKTSYSTQIEFVFGDAKRLISNFDFQWDLVFIDADKEAYGLYYDLVIDQLSPGGVILVDNVLWSGKVLLENATDKSTKALKAFNQKIIEDTRVENVLLPIRDGINLIRKKNA